MNSFLKYSYLKGEKAPNKQTAHSLICPLQERAQTQTPGTWGLLWIK